MAEPQYVKISRASLRPGVTLAVNLFVYLPLNKKVVSFKAAGTPFTDADMKNLKSVPEGCLIALKSELDQQTQASAGRISEALNRGDSLQTETIVAEAGRILRGLSASLSPVDGPTPMDALTELHQATTSIVSSVKEASSSKTYEKLIRSLGQKTDPLTAHHMQVSALAVVFLLAEGKGTPEELVELAAAGLVHDLGLAACDPGLFAAHCQGNDEELLAKNPAYKAHPEASVKMADSSKSGAKLSQLARQAVLYHHEYLDQSGLRGTSELGIPRLARFLCIADDVVSKLGYPNNQRGLDALLSELTYEKFMKYDRHIISAIHQHFLSSEF